MPVKWCLILSVFFFFFFWPPSEPGKTAPAYHKHQNTKTFASFFLVLQGSFWKILLEVWANENYAIGTCGWTGPCPFTPLQGQVCGGWGEDGGGEKQSLILGNQKKRSWNFFKLATLNNPKQVSQRPNSPDNHVPSCLSAQKVSSWRHLNQEKEARGRRA